MTGLVWRPLLIASALVLSAAAARADEPTLMGLPRAEFKARRDALRAGLDKTGRSWVVILRGADEPELEARFRQSDTFAYLTGLDAPRGFLLMASEPRKEVLYLPPPNPFAAMEESVPAPGRETAERLGIEQVESTEKMLSDVFAAIGDPVVRTRGPARPLVYTQGAEARGMGTAEARFARFLREGAPNTEFREVGALVAPLRKVKSPAELAAIEKAIALTAEAQTRVVQLIKPGVAEYQLEARIVSAFLDGGGDGAAFPSIVGSGPNSTIPHYFANRRTLADGDVVVVDIGAASHGYAADITRTYPASGTFTPRQREVYQLVLDAQKAVEERMKPGDAKLRGMTEFTKEFFKKSPLRAKDEDGNEHTLDHFFIHGLGHYLGLEVHDVGATDVPVQVGEVFTIEPGLYIKSENLGVRIEDDYVMTESGPRKLSAAIPSDPAEIERRIAEARKAGSGPVAETER